ncbi:FBXL20 [Branchiostoma lanceolatum]|uniref:FBXL20 protein n=1 Tax=Branchiostoma lanceolatum TaxID=7740 RepID=A0A8J9ZBW4_BRALA|nr:FBXL20 [Branchiostoma lanceolatum]
MAEQLQNLFSFVPLCHQKHGVETDQSRVTTLQFQSQTVVLRTVLRLGETSPFQCGHIRAQLAGGAYGVLCSSIRERIVSDFPKMLTDELLWLLVPPHVKVLDLSRCCNVRCHNLRTLILSDLVGVTFDLRSIPQACPHLTSLNLSSNPELDDGVVRAALRQWRHLCHLDLSYCDNITDDCFLLPDDDEEEEAGPLLHPGASGGPQGDINNSTQGCKLASVDLSGCLQLTTKCIRHLTALCGPTLQVLNIGYTSVDCSALWFLCGYSLFTAVQLAVAVDNQGACPPMQDNRLLSPELIHKILTGELHHGNHQPITIGVPDGVEMEGESNGSFCLTPSVDMPPSGSNPEGSGLTLKEAKNDAMPCGIAAAAKDCGMQDGYPSASSLVASGLKKAENDATEAGACGIAAAKDCGKHDVKATEEKDDRMLQRSDGILTPEDDGIAPRNDGIPMRQSKYAWGEQGARPSERPQKLKMKPSGEERTFRLQSYRPNVTSLDISGMNMTMSNTANIGNACIKAFVSANRNLRKLSLTWKEISDETVEFIGQHAKDLRYLSMIDCDRTSPFSLAALGCSCSKLEYLDVKGMSFIGDAGLIPLVVNNPQLQTLSLAECNIMDLSLEKVAKFLGEGLTCLDLSWCEEITDSGLSCVVGACRNLQQLSLRQCLSTAHTLVRLGENCRQLRSLMMSGVEGMTDGVLVSMAENLGLLEELDVSWNLDLTDLSISRVLVCCPRLRDARLAGLKRITSKPFLPIISDLARWRRCQSLLKLKEKERRVFEEEGEEQWSSDEEFEDLYVPHRSASYAPCLRDLDLEYSDMVNDDYLAEIVAVCHGTLRIRDYYGEHIQPKWTGSMHFFM